MVEACHCLTTIGDRDSSHKVSIVPRLGIRSDRVLCQGCLFEPVSARAYFLPTQSHNEIGASRS
ncbi:MAG: hypothetical protein NT070_11485 [Cyanobacteria bacterium]|nr:hypothetical protein [Cyanobacteriota bacterium]